MIELGLSLVGASVIATLFFWWLDFPSDLAVAQWRALRQARPLEGAATEDTVHVAGTVTTVDGTLLEPPLGGDGAVYVRVQVEEERGDDYQSVATLAQQPPLMVDGAEGVARLQGMSESTLASLCQTTELGPLIAVPDALRPWLDERGVTLERTQEGVLLRRIRIRQDSLAAGTAVLVVGTLAEHADSGGAGGYRQADTARSALIRCDLITTRKRDMVQMLGTRGWPDGEDFEGLPTYLCVAGGVVLAVAGVLHLAGR